MEISPWLIYLILQLDSVIGILKGVIFVSSISTIVCLFVFAISSEFEKDEKLNRGAGKYAKKFGGILLVSAILIAIVPSTKTAILIYGLPQAAEYTGTLDLGDTGRKSIKVFNKMLDSYLMEEEETE